MKLYFKSGTCALAPHIVLSELNMVYELEAVDLTTKTTVNGDYKKINPKGLVPAMRLDNGEILTEGAIISQYLADQKPESGLMPKFGTFDRYRCAEWMNFITSDIHKTFGQLFGAPTLVKNPEAMAEFKTNVKTILDSKISIVSERLGTNDYLMGKQFTIADAYLFTVLSWSKHVDVSLAKWGNIETYMGRVGARPAVMKAMKEEGLLK
ncbi:MAG TPA: glutathione transferase GstA [Bacteriovoracaceae bacterium]|nr:glutathione transferase GstA [Bacteriovoracaceae bacterium]